MSQFPHHTVDPNWTRSDAFHNSFLLHPDAALDHALTTSDANGLPRIAVSRAQGKLLTLVARSISAKRILEVGTLGGYALSPHAVTWRFSDSNSLQVLDAVLRARPARGGAHRDRRARAETR